VRRGTDEAKQENIQFCISDRPKNLPCNFAPH
jgi:hypothetical protein